MKFEVRHVEVMMVVLVEGSCSSVLGAVRIE